MEIEILSGPLDGACVTLRESTEWSRAGGGPLSFPWDDELGEPQARFTLDEEGWGLEGVSTRHGTYRVNTNERVVAWLRLSAGDILKSCQTWMQVRRA